MAEDLDSIFGEGAGDLLAAAEAEQQQGTGITLNITDEDLDEAASQAIEFKPVPQYTRLNLVIFDVIVGYAKGQKTAGCLQWRVVLRAEEDTWGPNRQFSEFVTFSEEFKFMWLPFVKGVGLVNTAGGFTVPDPESTFGLRCSGRVKGHEWLDDSEQRARSYGKQKQAIPTDGRAVFERLDNWMGPVDAEGNQLAVPAEPASLEGLNEFKAAGAASGKGASSDNLFD